MGKPVYFLAPLPLWSLGIIGLAGNCEKIYRAQQLAGKILPAKDLWVPSFGHIYRLRFGHDALVADGAQGLDVTMGLWISVLLPYANGVPYELVQRRLQFGGAFPGE